MLVRTSHLQSTRYPMPMRLHPMLTECVPVADAASVLRSPCAVKNGLTESAMALVNLVFTPSNCATLTASSAFLPAATPLIVRLPMLTSPDELCGALRPVAV